MSLSLPAPPSDNRFRVLLVEDDEVLAHLILGFLERTGFDCRYATDAEAGMIAFNEAKPHLLLAPLSSSQVDGQALCRWVREKSGIPVLIIGPNDESTEVAAFKTGADDYLVQPLRPAVLMARVVAHLRRAYRYNEAPAPIPEGISNGVAHSIPGAENPFGLLVEEEKKNGILPSGWAECDACGYVGPRFKFEKEDYFGDLKFTCPHCQSTEHVIFSLD